MGKFCANLHCFVFFFQILMSVPLTHAQMKSNASTLLMTLPVNASLVGGGKDVMKVCKNKMLIKLYCQNSLLNNSK